MTNLKYEKYDVRKSFSPKYDGTKMNNLPWLIR